MFFLHIQTDQVCTCVRAFLCVMVFRIVRQSNDLASDDERKDGLAAISDDDRREIGTYSKSCRSHGNGFLYRCNYATASG